MIEVCGSLVDMVCRFAVLAFYWCCSTQFCNVFIWEVRQSEPIFLLLY